LEDSHKTYPEVFVLNEKRRNVDRTLKAELLTTLDEADNENYSNQKSLMFACVPAQQKLRQESPVE